VAAWFGGWSITIRQRKSDEDENDRTLLTTSMAAIDNEYFLLVIPKIGLPSLHLTQKYR